jgi:hypothetical protein
MDKTVETLTDLLARDVQRLMYRHVSAISWLELVQPVVERNWEREEKAHRFRRREGASDLHSEPRAVPPLQASAEDARFGNGSLPPVARERLRELIGPEVDQARIHVNEAADAFARAERADAVTVGKDIYFQSHAFAPDSPRGFGLLAHEMTHVAESERPGVGWRRSTSASIRGEEYLAGSRQLSAMQLGRSPAAAPPPSEPRQSAEILLGRMPLLASPVSPALASAVTPPRLSPVAAVPASPAAHLRPMRGDAAQIEPEPPVKARQNGPGLEVLRRTLFRDLMAQMRVEFERGA